VVVILLVVLAIVAIGVGVYLAKKPPAPPTPAPPAPTPAPSPPAPPVGGTFRRIALQADTGKYLARCHNCTQNATSKDAAFVHVNISEGNPRARWQILTLANGKVTLQSDTGKYLAVCTRCAPGVYPDAAFVNVADVADPNAQWTLEERGDGKVNLMGNNGRYLARCQNCYSDATYADAAFVHGEIPNNSWAKWTVVEAS